MNEQTIRRALISVSDKRGLVEFATGLKNHGVEIISTGGTARALRDAGIPITEIDSFTGFPEMLDGRVKTLHPRVHAGILYRREDPEHVQSMKSAGLESIDLVTVNLYPFEETVARPDVTREEAVEQIDIGGPSMLRSAAKNHASVTVVSSPDQYEGVLRDMAENNGSTSLELRKRLALDVFQRTAAYDAAIWRFFSVRDRQEGADAPSEALPETFELSEKRVQQLRYGENPHQAAALYGGILDHFRKLHGKELSYNNIVDLAAAQEMVETLAGHGTAAVIVKHTNPCGAAVSDRLVDVWGKALATDPQSASGGIIAFSAPVDLQTAEAMSGHFIEILMAPGFEPEALEVLKRRKNRILLEVTSPLAAGVKLTCRSVPDGLLVQTADARRLEDGDIRVVTRRPPTQDEMKALKLAWDVVRFVKSNAIVFAAADRTLGVGAGQMSRVDSARIAVLKAGTAGLDLSGSVVASDAFFPFPDGVLVAADAGATAVIQPGGSVRDEEVIEAADSRDLAMIFTGIRHFRH